MFVCLSGLYRAQFSRYSLQILNVGQSPGGAIQTPGGRSCGPCGTLVVGLAVDKALNRALATASLISPSAECCSSQLLTRESYELVTASVEVGSFISESSAPDLGRTL